MRIALDQPRKLAPLLWVLLGLFVLRVGGQALVAFGQVEFLPPMQEWHSGLLPYEVLLTSQIIIIVLMTKVCIDFTRGVGPLVAPRRFLAVHWLYFGYLYLATMIARYPIRLFLHPESRWFDGLIPIFFHWVLAIFVISVGLHHRNRLRKFI
ncbi:MAG TPA: hypothetical protein VGA24_03320 [Steroidobacteraceae bacterium]